MLRTVIMITSPPPGGQNA